MERIQKYDSSDSACEALGSFANEVDALRGKQIPTPDVDALIADAEAIRTSLDCA